MIKWMTIDIAVFAGVMTLTGVIIPQILLIAFRKNLFDAPDPRKIHKTEVPRLGGIAFFPSILFSLFLLFGFGIQQGGADMHDLLEKNVVPMSFISGAAIVLYLTGMADDLVGVRYSAKFIMQAIASALLITGGLQLDSLQGFIGIEELPSILSVFLTALLIIFIINAINLIDGIDGLASGLSAIACSYYAFVFFHNGLYVFSATAVATLGALIPFFIYNVFGNPERHRKIFMGDTGALTIGLYLSAFSLRVSNIETMNDGFNPLVIAFAPLLIPCFDVVRVYLHRIKAGRNPFLPDKTHIHHKLLALGMRQRMAMPVIIMASAVLTAANYLLSTQVGITVLFFSDLALWIAINMLLTRAIRNREKRLGVTLFE